MRFKSFLIERRKFKDSYDYIANEILKYKDGEYYAHLTDGLGWDTYKPTFKVGINPQHRYKTPTGIYAYPIWEVVHSISRGELPYKQDANIVYIFEAKSPESVVRASEYTASDLENDLDTLSNITKTSRQLLSSLDKTIEGYHPLDRLLRITDRLTRTRRDPSTPRPHAWGALLYKLYDGIVEDIGEGIIHISEPNQAVFFNKAAIKYIDVIYPISPGSQKASIRKTWSENEKIIIRSTEDAENFKTNSNTKDVDVVINLDAPSKLIDIKREERDGPNDLLVMGSRIGTLITDRHPSIRFIGSKINKVVIPESADRHHHVNLSVKASKIKELSVPPNTFGAALVNADPGKRWGVEKITNTEEIIRLEFSGFRGKLPFLPEKTSRITLLNWEGALEDLPLNQGIYIMLDENSLDNLKKISNLNAEQVDDILSKNNKNSKYGKDAHSSNWELITQI